MLMDGKVRFRIFQKHIIVTMLNLDCFGVTQFTIIEIVLTVL